MYWKARRLWPGDPMFSPDTFGELSATYVIRAVRHGQELRRREPA